MAKAIHTMIRVLDTHRSVKFYRDAFGLQPSHVLDYPDFCLTYLRNDENDFEIELTENKGRTEPYEHGSAYGHLAVCVSELESEHARMKAAGMSVGDVKAMRHGDEVVARFFFITDPDGYKIEVLEKRGHYV
jgi:lactoylglutathione lyase